MVSPEQELVQGAAIVQKWHWGFSSTFAPSLMEVVRVAAEDPRASRKGVQSQVTQSCEWKK